MYLPKIGGTLRGKSKVSTQWKLFTLVHNIEKIAHCAAA